MSQDFFADLERQLVDAATDRRRRLRRARTRRAATMATIVVAVLAAGGGLAAAVTGSGGGAGDGSSSGLPAGRGATTAERTVTVDPQTGAIDQIAPQPGRFTVAVLNGTTVPGLARGVANRLQEQRFKIGVTTNAATQDRSTTQVFYARPDCMAAAARTARAISLPRASPIGSAPKAALLIAGEDADVIVVAGSDQNAALKP